jgi:hypothetical protein
MSDLPTGKVNPADDSSVTIRAFQNFISEIYFKKDNSRGVPATFMWLME